MLKLKDTTIDFLIDVLNKEINEEYSYLLNGMGGEDKSYIKNLIETKKELLILKIKPSSYLDRIILKELIQDDLKKLEELK